MPDQRHVPIRTCVICGQKSPERELLRIVRLEDGSAVIDDLRRLNGRGCYACSRDGRFDLAELKGKIKRALKLESDVPVDLLQQLATRLDSQ